MSSPAAAPSSPIAPTPPPTVKEEQVPAPTAESAAAPSLEVAPIPTPEPPKDALDAISPPPLAPAPATQESSNDAPVPEQKNEQPPTQQQPIPQTPQVYLTFLLLSGRRRTMNFEPATAIGRVKEVVWNGWTGGDWPAEDRPPAPSYLRVLHAGRMLQDDETLANLKLPIYTPPATSSTTQESTPQPQPPTTIMHISVRPFGNGEQDLEDGSVKKTGRRGRRRDGGTTTSDGDATEEPRSGCCGCCIIC